MAFSSEGAAEGAAAGAIAGPWGALIGGVVGGFFGGKKKGGAAQAQPNFTISPTQITFGGIAVGSGRNTTSTTADQRAALGGTINGEIKPKVSETIETNSVFYSILLVAGVVYLIKK